MKITVHENPDISEPEVSVICSKVTEEIHELIANISLIGESFAGTRDEEVCFIPINDIYYFESVDGKSFFYTETDTYEAAEKLYQIEEKLRNRKFARVSKTAIVNLKMMHSIKKAENSRLVATLANGEKLLVSRKYVFEIRKKLGV